MSSHARSVQDGLEQHEDPIEFEPLVGVLNDKIVKRTRGEV
jgi:hypothetical protein